jgi:hypothetical protein
MGVIKEHTTVIDGKTYTCKTFPATEGLVILPKLISVLGEAVTNLVFGVDDAELAEAMSNPKIIGAMLVKISERVSENDGLLVLKELLAYTSCDQVKVGDAEINQSVYDRFDSHFAGDYMHLINVVSWVARASFGNP